MESLIMGTKVVLNPPKGGHMNPPINNEIGLLELERFGEQRKERDNEKSCQS
jgi:hypothetical protein